MRPFCDTCDYWNPAGKRHCLILSGGRPVERPPCTEYMRAPELELAWRDDDPDWLRYRDELTTRLEALDHDGLCSDLSRDPGSA